ncbi:MAG: GGDEF domain-containing protein [Ideonella sp. WA131b]|jgi:diguanylate cyclase (GGDEF)-like protein|nr:GGDEF domain-containing protein [Ideonella sp. WA131b]
MSNVVDHLAELTGLRDRDVLDVTLVSALRDLLCPRLAAIYRVVGEAPGQRWMTRARLAEGDVSAQTDSLWADLSELPALDEHADRAACLRRQEAYTLAAGPGGAAARAYFPLANEFEAVGVLELHTDAQLRPEEVRLVGSILRIYRNFQGLLDYSERDTLTGLLNRKTFDESFLRMLAGTAASSTQTASPGSGDARRLAVQGSGRGTAWLGVIDIDHFKRVNDGHGHLIGDEVLLLLSRLMRASFRFHDHLFRFGGEEFVVLMRCGTDADASGAFERLRANVERFAFPQVGRITVSVGFSALRPDDTPSAAFERADKAVYWAKQNGRNQVAFHADLVDRGLLAEASLDNRDAELF